MHNKIQQKSNSNENRVFVVFTDPLSTGNEYYHKCLYEKNTFEGISLWYLTTLSSIFQLCNGRNRKLCYLL